MRILIVQPAVAPAKGGAQAMTAVLAAGLAARGHDMHLVGDYAAVPALHAPLLDAGVTIHPQQIHGAGARAAWWLRGLVRRVQPAVVQSALRSADVATSIATLGAGIPHVVVVQELLPTGHDEEHPSAVKTWLHRAALRRAALLVATSAYCGEHARAFADLPPERVVVVPNGIESHRFTGDGGGGGVALPGVPAGAPVVMLVGRLSEEKRPALLLDVTARLLPRFPELRAAFVGDGPLRGAIEAEARARGLAEHVVLLGTRDDVPRLYAAARVVVHCCDVEGFGLVPAEAMAAGRAVVASGAGGVADIVEDGRTGYLVPVGDDEAAGFAERVGALLADPERAAAMGTAGRERVQSLFTPDRMLDGYEAAYARVIGVAQ